MNNNSNYEINLTDSRGHDFTCPINFSTRKSISFMISYGELEIKANYYYIKHPEKIRVFFNQVLIKEPYSHAYFDRPFYKKDDYIFKLGKKLNLTSDKLLENNPNFFYCRDNNPLKKYKKEFTEYLYKRVYALSLIVNKNVEDFKIIVGSYQTFRAACKPYDKVLKFDLRLFAFDEKISDFIIYHELNHLNFMNHKKDFHDYLSFFCPNHKEYDAMITAGDFEGKPLNEI